MNWERDISDLARVAFLVKSARVAVSVTIDCDLSSQNGRPPVILYRITADRGAGGEPVHAQAEITPEERRALRREGEDLDRAIFEHLAEQLNAALADLRKMKPQTKNENAD